MKKIKNYFHMYTISRVNDFAEPLRQAKIPYIVHIVMDREIKERLCSEICGINLSALIIGSRGSVGDYCELYCVCPVVVVRYSDGKDVEEDVVSTANSAVGNFAANSAAENSTANSVAEVFTGNFVMAPPKETYVEEIDEILRLKNEGLLGRGLWLYALDFFCFEAFEGWFWCLHIVIDWLILFVFFFVEFDACLLLE